MGKIVKSIFKGVSHAVGSIFGVHRQQQPAPQPASHVPSPVANQQPQPNPYELHYRNALETQQRNIQAEHTKKLSEIVESQKRLMKDKLEAIEQDAKVASLLKRKQPMLETRLAH